MGRRQGVLLVIILLGLGVLFWTNPVMAKFSCHNSGYRNFYIALAPVTSDVPSAIISQGTYGSEIYGDNKGIERVQFTFERRSNGKFYFRYSTQGGGCHPSHRTLCEFTPMLETGEIVIKVFAESRVADSDESGVDVNVFNSTGLPVHFLIYGDDKERPRVGRIQVDQGLLRVNQQDVPSGTWQGLPQVRIDNYPPPYHPLEVLMQSNGIDVAFSSDGSMLAMAYKGYIVDIYSTDDYRLLQKLDVKIDVGYPRCLAFSPVTEDNILAVGLPLEVRLFNLSSGMTKSIKLNDYLDCFVFSPDGTQLATVSSEIVQIWDTSSGTCLRTLEMPYIPNSVAFSPDWSTIACGYYNKGIDLYSASDGTLIRSLEPVPGKETSVYNLAFSPDGQKLAGYFHSDDYSQTGGICLWQPSDGSLLNHVENIITYRQRASCKLLFTPDNQHLVTLIDDVKFWNVPDLSLEYTLSPARDISRLAISPDGQYLACLGIDRIELWQIGNVALPETGVRMTACLENMRSYRHLLCYQVSAPEAVVKGRLYINDQVFEHDVGSWHQYNVITRWDKFFYSPGIYCIRYETEDVNGNCQSSETIEIQLNGIKLTPRYWFPVALTVGDEPVTLTAEIFTDSASDTLIWETDNSEVLSLAEDRNSVTITPLTPGNAWVSAKVAGKSSASTRFIVYPAVNGINLDKSELIFGDGAVAGTLQAIISPEDTLKQQVLWRTTDESVARVEGNGLTATVTAVGSGEATIIAETEQGGYTASCRVTVPVGLLFTATQLYDTGSNGTGLRLIFNRDISPDSAYDSISLNDDNGQPVECTMSINGPRLDIVPTTRLQEGSTYSFIIPAASLKDNSGHSRPNSYQGQFIAVSSFSQNEGQGGYQAGMYEGYGIQPTEYNWTRQSRFNGGGGAEQKWSFATGAVSPTAAVIGSDGTIYVSGDDGCLYAVNPDGSKKWAYYTGEGTSPVIGKDGTIYVGSEDGNLYAINPDGSRKWCYYTTDSFSVVLAAPAIAKDGTIYFGSTDQHLYALNPDGTMKWSYYTDFGGAIFTTPAIASDGTIYVTTNRIDKILYAINPDGSLKWSLDGISGTPVIGSDGTIYVGEDDLCAINPDGTIKWTLKIKNSGIALSKEGNIYAASGNGKVLALDLSGKQKWEYLINDKPTGSPLIGSDGTVYIASNKGQLYAINLEGICLWQYDTGNTLAASPSMGADGTIYLTAADGNLYAIDTGSDINPPILISTNPENGSQYIKVDTAITFLFNEKIQAGSAFDNITVMDDDNNPITINKEVSGRTLTITPTDQWPYGTKCKLTIPASAVYDLANNGMPTEYCYTFITVVAPCNNQGEGYQAGAYDQGAVQPTVYNWSRQSRFNGSDSAGQEWMYSTNGVIKYSPAIRIDGIIYLSTSSGLEAIASDGSKKWTFLEGNSMSSSPAIGWDGTIYIGAGSKGFYAINQDGSQKWAFAAGGYISSSPAIGADGTIYVGSDDKKLYAINPDGSQKWAFATGGYIGSSPAIGTDGTIYVGSHDQNLYAINPDGSQKWSLLMEEYVGSSPAIGADGTIYVGCYQSLYAINPDGSQKWSFLTRGRVGSSVAIGVDGTIYVSSDGNLYAINPDGSQKWSFATEKLVRDPVIGANGIIYIGSKGDSYTGSNGYLYAINPDGSPKWCFTTGHISCSSPVIGDGVFYVYGDKKLFCIGPDKEAPNIIRTNPVNESTRASVNQNIYVSFNENIQAGPAYDLISIKDDQNNLVPFTKDIRLSTLIIKPDRPLNTYSKYFVSVPSNAVTDIALNNFAMDYEFSFTTWTTFSNNQGSGYQPGAYDQEAVQPASFNWSRQSRYSGSDSATLMWSFTTKRISYSTPAIGRDGTLYIGTDGGVYAINSDGSQKWLFQADSVFKSSPAIGEDGTIYIVPSYGLWAINPDGSPKWKFSYSSSGSSPAIGDDGTIYIGSNDQKLYAVNPDGTLKWSFITGGKIASSPAIGADGTIYVGSDDKKLYAINRDGSLKWSFTTGGKIASSPAIGTDGTIYVGSVDGNLYAINPDGSQQWLFEIGYSISSGPAIGKDGTIYIEAERLWAINPDGTKKWSTAENVSISGSPIIGADGTIYIGTCGQAFFAFNPDGTQKWAYIADKDGSIGTQAAIDDGVVYICGGGSNIIYCIGADKKPPLIIRTDPENGSSQAATCQNIMISFNENVQAGPCYDLITIKDAQNRVVPCIKEIQPLSLILKPCEPLNGYTQHYVFIPSDAITDKSSNSLASDYEFSFTTWAVFDNNQGVGYQPGAYDQEAIQPAVFNWSRQSKFIGSNCATRKWSFMTGSAIGSSSPAIGADGTIYIGSNDRNLYAINPDGSQKWSFMTGRLIYFSSAAIPAIGADGTIYIGSNDKNLYAINPDGSQKWMFTTGDYIVSSPAIGADGTIYVGSCDKNLYAINPDGSKKWYFVTGGEIHSSPAIGVDGTIYIGSSDGNLYAINLYGNKVWSFTTGGMIYSSPAIGADGTIYVGSYDKNLYAINPDGSLKWSFPTGDRIYSSPAIGADGTIYIGSNDKNLYAINPDGSPKWSFMTGHWIESSPVIGADGTIYVGTADYVADQHLYAINPDGSLKWNWATANCIRSSPAIGADGTIYVGSDDKCLYAIGTPNQVPEAVEVIITGQPLVGENLTASYTYQDNENDPEGQSIFKWFRCANDEGTGKEEIPEAGDLTYTLTIADEGTYLFFEVTPVAAAGTLTGIPVLSAACGPVSGSPEEDPVAAELTGLSIREGSDGSGVELITDFDGNNLNQSLIVNHDIEAVTVVPVVAANTTVRVQVVCGESITEITDGVVVLDYGINTINVVVNEEGKTDRTYIITVDRNTVDECFIATAAYGSKLAPGVVLLRSFRDQYLLTNTLGKAFVEYYYHNSPPIAAYISRHEPLKAGVRVLLLPAIGIAYTAFHPSLLVLAIFLLGTLVLYRKKYSTK